MPLLESFMEHSNENQMGNSYLQRLFAYDTEANRQTLQSMIATEQLDPKNWQLFAHMLAAKEVWLARITGRETAGLVVWPEPDRDRSEEQLDRIDRDYRNYLDTLSDSETDRVVEYRTSRGEPFATPVGDVLHQVLFHGSYHRGQIAQSIRESGGTPAVTDFIFYARHGDRL